MGFLFHFNQLDWVSHSLQASIMANFFIFYFALEGRKYLFAPMQMKWYSEVSGMEVDNINKGLIEDIGDSADKAIEDAKE